MTALPNLEPSVPTHSRFDGILCAITLDVGSTLIDPHPSVGHIYAQVAAEAGFPNLSPELLNERFHAAFHGRSQPLHAHVDWATVVDQTFQGLVEPAPSRSFFSRLYRRFIQPEAWRIYPDVVPALTELQARRVPLAIVSNWDERLRPLLRSLELDGYFQQIVVSCESGCSKPSSTIFQHAARCLCLPPNSILHVGDHPKEDIQGARDAGFQAVLLDRSQPPIHTIRISALTELLELPIQGRWNDSKQTEFGDRRPDAPDRDQWSRI